MALEKELNLFNNGISQTNTSLEILKKSILDGESTGDKLIDACILIHGKDYLEPHKVYAKNISLLEEKLKSTFAIRQDFHYQIRHNSSHQYDDDDFILKSRFYLISPKCELNFEPKSCQFQLIGNCYDLINNKKIDTVSFSITLLENLKFNEHYKPRNNQEAITILDLDSALEHYQFHKQSRTAFLELNLPVPDTIEAKYQEKLDKLVEAIEEKIPKPDDELKNLLNTAKTYGLLGENGLVIERKGKSIDISKFV